MANVKKVFRKAPSRIQYFKSIIFISITRTNYNTEYLDKSSELLLWPFWANKINHWFVYNDNDAVSIKYSKKYLSVQSIGVQFMFIKLNFGLLLLDLITRLEKQEIPLVDYISIEKLIKTPNRTKNF